MSEFAVKEHMDVIGADGVHVGTVDRVEKGRIKLTKADSGEGKHRGHHHYVACSSASSRISVSLVFLPSSR